MSGACKIFSYISLGMELESIEIEVSVVPGLPQISILGLPDTALRESQVRLKSALRAQGFHGPVAKQWIVNLKPHRLKKTSGELDFPIALACLLATGQIKLDVGLGDAIYAVGSVSLNGSIETSEKLVSQITSCPLPLLVGSLSLTTQLPKSVDLWEAKTLREAEFPRKVFEAQRIQQWVRPEIPKLAFTAAQARIISAVALGEHATLLTGPAGSGKTTALRAVSALLETPSETLFRQSQVIAYGWGDRLHWRPHIGPHHSVTPLAMVGGGHPIVPGEFSRAHGGILQMDEFLEFDPKIQESLREPLEEGRIRLARSGSRKELPCDFLLLASTNLCPCGEYIPGGRVQCQRSLIRCRSYLQKLSGPILDRFHIVYDWKSNSQLEMQVGVTAEQIFDQLEATRLRMRGELGPHIRIARLADSQFPKFDESMVHRLYLQGGTVSLRRKHSFLRVALTLAYLDGRSEIAKIHLEEAYELTIAPARRLKDIVN